ncbi:amino acid adenylation domain-containing protein [Pedobacter sp. PAMC26386]|nr:amino acid adenylation domain-containing protein [Pedobacter sp. PAMC26386]
MRDLLNKIRDNNILLEIIDGELKVFASDANVDPDLIAAIKKNKKELFQILSENNKLEFNDSFKTSIPLAPEQENYPLSSAQLRLWAVGQYEEANVAYNMSGVYEFQGELNISILTDAFNLVLERHEILRTVFIENEAGEPVQLILPSTAIEFNIGYEDLREPKFEDDVNTLIAKELNTSFELESAPLFRAKLFQTDDHKWVFTYVMHHIIGDGWSMDILIKELLLFYSSKIKGIEALLSPLPIQYKDYAAWQQEQLKGDGLKDHKAYWLNQFSGDLPVLELMNEYPRPLVKTYHGGTIERNLDSRVLEGIRRLSQQLGGTLFMGLLSGVTALLHLYSGQDDLIIGSPIAGREHADLEGQIGFYLNTLALRMQFKGEQNYSELFDHVREVTLSAYDHQAYPFDQLIGELAIKRDFSRNALFDVLIDYHDVRESKLKQEQNFDGLIITEYKDNVREVSKFDLTFMFIESEAGLSLLLEYNSDLYSLSRAEQLFGHLEGLLLSAISFPLQALSKLSYLNSSEQSQLLGPLGCGGEGSAYRSVLSLFTEQVSADPEGIAVVYGDVSLSYGELDRRSGELAAELVKGYGVHSGSLVGIMQDRSLELVISILGVLKSGGAYVPIDPVYPASRKEYIMGDTGLSVLLTQTDYIFDLDYYSGQLFAVDAQLEGLSGGAVLHKDNLSTDQAYVIYTSGSTGQPKGCGLSHGNLSHYIQWANKYYFKGRNSKQAVDSENVMNSRYASGNFGLYTSLSFDLTVTSIFCALSLGSCLRVYGQQGELTDILRDSFGSSSGIDSIKLTPSHINLLQHLDLSSSSMLCAIVGGEAVSAAHVSILKKINPEMRIYNEYGPTETTVGCVVKELQLDENVLIGRPISGMSVYLTDSSGGLVPVGVAGEICISGDGVGSGYLNKAELSGSKFIANPFRVGERMYLSGDLGRWTSSGELEFLGRGDEQVKIRGYRIELGEIESQLQGYGGLSEAVVLAQPGSGGEQELVAYVVSDSVLDINSLRSYLGRLLPAYLIPSHFVQVESIPLTSNGKADRKQLAAAGGLSLNSGTEYVAPRNVTEEKLVGIWEEILGKTGIGVLDNFFELGGHSLTAIRLVSQLHKEFQVKIELKDLFSTVILEDQALLVSGSAASIFRGITALDLQADYVLSSAQRRLWVLSQFEEGSIAYNIPGTYEFSGELNLDVFRTSFDQLISRHEILRTIFKEDAQGDVRQVILRSIDFHLGYQDLRGQGFDGKVLDQLVEEVLLEPFDLSHGPLLRAGLYQLADRKWVFSYVMHHIISDGWSMEVLIGELLSFYNSGLKGEPALLQGLSIQYKDYAAWQQDQLQGEQLASHKAYWLEQFSGDLPVLELVNEYPRPSVKSYHGGVIERSLDPRVLEGIRGLSHQHGGTLFMGLLSGVTALLYRYSGQQDVVIGSPIAGREHADLDGQIGFYLNTLAFRMHFDGDQSYQDLLAHVREVTLSGYAHQVYPFDELVDALSLKRDFSRNVLFDVLIDYHDLRSTSLQQQSELEGLQVSGYQGSAAQVSKFDLTFMFIESEAGLSLLLEYNSDLYSLSRAEQLFGHLEGLLLSAISFPLQALSKLSYLNSSEQSQLLGPLGSGGEGSAYRSVLSLFTEQVSADPEGIAVVYGDVSLSYGELDRRSGELAAELVKGYGVHSGSLVGIMQDRSLELVISILGVLKSGGAYVPIDPVYPASRKEYIMGDTGLSVLLTQTDYIFDLDYYSGQLFAVDAQLEGLSGGAVLHKDNLSTDQAYVIYTSGSTGQPKGCGLSHGNLSHYIQWANKYYFNGGVPAATGNTDKTAVGNFGLYTSLSFDLTVTSIFCALSLGSCLRVYGQQGELTDILRDSFGSSSGIDSIKLTPSHINLLQHLDLSSSSMLCAIVGGEAVSAAHVSILKKINPEMRIYNEYGPTETTVGCVVKELQLDENVLIGRPISGMSVYLTDSSGGLVPVGVAGEICISGDGVGSGYLNKAELSGSKFIANPFRVGERMYLSGDLGRWTSSGELEFLGRGDEQVKIRGYRIELGEIESQLQGYGELSEAVVLAQPGSGGEQELVAYVVSDSVLDINSLRSYLGRLLPAYLIPSHFVQVESIPLTSNGKADRKQLAAAGGLSLNSGTEYVAPRNVTEEQVAQIWSEVLEKAQVGIRDDFFDLGGDSIKILRMMAGLRRELGVDIPIGEVYRNSTIEGLMAHIVSHEQELAEGQVRHQAEEAAVRAELEELRVRILSELEDSSNIEDIYPMSDIEKGMVFESLVSKNKGVYHDLKVFQRIFFDFDA